MKLYAVFLKRGPKKRRGLSQLPHSPHPKFTIARKSCSSESLAQNLFFMIDLMRWISLALLQK